MTTRVKFHVPGISCDHCKASIEGALAPLPGVLEAGVDVGAKTATVAFAPDQLGPHEIVAAITDQGYDVESFEEVG